MSEVLAAPVVQQNLRLVLQRIKEACQRFGRADSPRLVAVGKTFPASQTRACYEAGQRHFGENYVQELAEKAAELKDECSEIRWHFIGNIQSNKVSAPRWERLRRSRRSPRCPTFGVWRL